MFKKILGAFSKDDEEPDETTPEAAHRPVDASALGAKARGAHDNAEPAEADAASPAAAAGDPVDTGGSLDKEDLRDRIEDALRTIYDPEIPVNIYDIGLIYEITPRDDATVYVKMTLTSPSCPAAGILPGQVESKVRGVDGVHDCELDLVFDPPWTPDRMSEAARLELGLM